MPSLERLWVLTALSSARTYTSASGAQGSPARGIVDEERMAGASSETTQLKILTDSFRKPEKRAARLAQGPASGRAVEPSIR